MKKTFKDLKSEEIDILIIGSGAAGITLAKSLSGKSRKVAVLESGSERLSRFSQKLSGGKSIGPSRLDLNTSRPRVLGGSTKIWGGVCRPIGDGAISKKDYIENYEWPLTYEDLVPYYKKASKMLGLEFNEFYRKGWRERNFTWINLRSLLETGSKFKGKYFLRLRPDRRDFSKSFKDLINNSKDITFFLNSTVTRLNCNSNKTSIESVEVRSSKGEKIVLNPKVTIVACGAIENARLMMLSGDIGNKSGLLGKCFMSHPGVLNVANIAYVEEETCIKKEDWNTELERFSIEIGDTLQKEMAIIGHSLDFSPLDKSIRSHLSEIKQAVLGFNLSPKKVSKIITNFPFKKLSKSGICLVKNKNRRVNTWKLSVGLEQPPSSSSYITLSKSQTDAFGQPKVEVFWDKLSKVEKETVKKVVNLIGIELGKRGLGRLQLSQGLKDGSVFNFNDPVNHHIGTTRMATTNKKGVVDKDCKVFGLDNLFIAGSSVFPTSASVNPTFTIIALSIRLGEHISKLKLS